MLGVKFGHKEYILTVLKDVETEVHRNPTLRARYPWFDGDDLRSERLAAQVRLTQDDKDRLEAAQSVLQGWVLDNLDSYMTNGRSPPGEVDCRVLAYGQIRPAIVVTDDLGMHQLASDFDIPVWHGWELLSKMRSAKVVLPELIREIYEALENNGDLTKTWREAKHTAFIKVFGPAPDS
jgi:hypothetical protein